MQQFLYWMGFQHNSEATGCVQTQGSEDKAAGMYVYMCSMQDMHLHIILYVLVNLPIYVYYV